jgi:hypothetical protein
MTVCCNVVEVTRPQEPFVAINQLPPSIVQLSAPGPQGPPGPAGGGGGSSGPILETQQTISANIVLSSGYNGMSVGDVAVAAGYTVTVPANANWVVL